MDSFSSASLQAPHCLGCPFSSPSVSHSHYSPLTTMSIFRVLTSVALSLALVSSSIAMPSEGSSVNVARELSFNPSSVALVPLKNFILPSKPAKRMTNAQRLSRGLAPNPPQRRALGTCIFFGSCIQTNSNYLSDQLKARASPTPTSDSSSSLPTPPVSSDSESASQSSSASDSSSSSSSSAASSDSSSPTSSATPTPTPVCGTQSGYLKARYSSLTGQYTDGYVSNAMNSFGEWGFTHSTSSALAVSYDTCEGSPATFLVTVSKATCQHISFVLTLPTERAN